MKRNSASTKNDPPAPSSAAALAGDIPASGSRSLIKHQVLDQEQASLGTDSCELGEGRRRSCSWKRCRLNESSCDADRDGRANGNRL